MPSGLAALLDDVATIAKLAAASIDDVGAAASKASVKAAGVVVDDTAVTPRYVTGFTPDRELPIIWRIARGSLRNKLLFILPAALALSAFVPWAITPILMIGGTYLAYEGAEKLIEAFSGKEHTLAEDAAELGSPEHEAQMVSGAIRTDFILSAEIMAIALAEVANQNFWLQALSLIVVAIGITIAVYGVVALIVKMDDVGLRLAQARTGFGRALGRGLVKAMPKLMAVLSVVGVAAMIWVGGGILVHGLHEFHLTPIPEWIDHAAETVSAGAGALSGLVSWVVHAIGSGIVGLIIGGMVAWLHHLWVHRKGADEAATVH